LFFTFYEIFNIFTGLTESFHQSVLSTGIFHIYV